MNGELPAIGDNGPIYAETLLGHSPVVEPWNTASNLVFLGIIIYWGFRLKKERNPLLLWCLPVLIVGYLGGTIYHGTRSHDIWMHLDYGPIVLLCIVFAIYFWRKVAPLWVALAGVAAVYGTVEIVSQSLGLEGTASASLGYVGMSVAMLLPALLLAKRSPGRPRAYLFSALALFAIAISFRQLDRTLATYLPQGTHFLWHLFGGASVQLLVLFQQETWRRSRSTTV